MLRIKAINNFIISDRLRSYYLKAAQTIPAINNPGNPGMLLATSKI